MGIFDLFRSEPRGVPARAPSPDAPRELLLYKYDSCPYCRRVMRAIEDLGVEVPMADTRVDRSNRQTLIEKTGRGTVPCLFIDGEPLFESLDIIAWLEAYAQQGATAR